MNILIVGTGAVAKESAKNCYANLQSVPGSTIVILASESEGSRNRASSIRQDIIESTQQSQVTISVKNDKKLLGVDFDCVVFASGSTLPNYFDLRETYEAAHVEIFQNIRLNTFNESIKARGKPPSWFGDFINFQRSQCPNLKDHSIKVNFMDLLRFATSRESLVKSCKEQADRLKNLWVRAANNYGRIDNVIWVTNPTDIGIYYSQRLLEECFSERVKSGENIIHLPNIVGAGIHLDTIRLKSFTAQREGCGAMQVNGHVMGQHGANSAPFFPAVTLAGREPYLSKGVFYEFMKFLNESNEKSHQDNISDYKDYLLENLKEGESSHVLKKIEKDMERKPIFFQIALSAVIHNLFGNTASATGNAVGEIIEHILFHNHASIAAETMVSFEDIFGPTENPIAVFLDYHVKLNMEWSDFKKKKFPFGVLRPANHVQGLADSGISLLAFSETWIDREYWEGNWDYFKEEAKLDNVPCDFDTYEEAYNAYINELKKSFFESAFQTLSS